MLLSHADASFRDSMAKKHANASTAKGSAPHEELEVFQFLKATGIEAYQPKAWHNVLERDLRRVRAKNRDEQKKQGQLDKIRLVFGRYIFRFPAAAFLNAVVLTALITAMSQSVQNPAAHAWLAAFGAAITSIVLCAAAFRLHWHFFEFERNKERRRFHELRHRNWHAVEHQLSTLQRVYEADSHNEDPDRGPKGLMGARLLSRHLWELVYLLKLDALLFEFDLKENVFDAARFRLAHGAFLVAGVAAAMGMIHFSGGHIEPLILYVVTACSAGICAAWVLYFHTAGAVRKKAAIVKRLFEPSLDREACALIGTNYEERHELEWSERYEYDELREYLVWLKAQLKTMKSLKENKPVVSASRVG